MEKKRFDLKIETIQQQWSVIIGASRIGRTLLTLQKGTPAPRLNVLVWCTNNILSWMGTCLDSWGCKKCHYCCTGSHHKMLKLLMENYKRNNKLSMIQFLCGQENLNIAAMIWYYTSYFGDNMNEKEAQTGRDKRTLKNNNQHILPSRSNTYMIQIIRARLFEYKWLLFCRNWTCMYTYINHRHEGPAETYKKKVIHFSN